MERKPVPAAAAQSAPPLRLVIREFELFSGTSPAVLNIPVRRLVYAEVLDVLLPG